MISSKTLLKLSGISRATLNNYIKNGLLPRPIIETGDRTKSVSSRLGFFPESSIETIKQIQECKEASMTMSEIINVLGASKDESVTNSSITKNLSYKQEADIHSTQQPKHVRCIPLVALSIRLGFINDIKSRLFAEEYFSFLNDLWRQVETILIRKGAVIGATSEDLMVCYFMGNENANYIESNYLEESIRCSLELQAVAKRLTSVYQRQHNWSQDIRINVGIAEGREWVGYLIIDNRSELRILGNTELKARFLTEIAKDGEVLIAKHMLDLLPPDLKLRIGYQSPRNIALGLTCHGHFATYTQGDSNIRRAINTQYANDISPLLFTELTHFA